MIPEQENNIFDSTLIIDLFLHKCNKLSTVIGTADLEISRRSKKQKH